MRAMTDPRRWPVDAWIALALTLISQLEVWVPDLVPGTSEAVDDPLMVSLTTLLMTVPLAFRRRMPLSVLTLGLGASALQQVLGSPAEGLSTLVALLIASYTSAAHARPQAVAAAGALIVVGSTAIGEDAADRVFIAIVLGAAWLTGLIVGQRSGEVARLTDDNRDLGQLLAQAAKRLAEAERLQAVRAPSAAPDELAALTARELEVVRAIATGMSNAEIAEELVISEWTVKTHVASVLRKLGVRDRAQVVVAAYESGLVRPGTGEPR